MKEQQQGSGATEREVMTSYLGRYVERHSDAEFDHFMRVRPHPTCPLAHRQHTSCQSTNP